MNSEMPGPYTLTEFEYHGIWHIFGPTIARWAAGHVRVGAEKDYPFRSLLVSATFGAPYALKIERISTNRIGAD